MCFVNDYDWTADTVERSEKIAEKPIRCEECRREIQAGQIVHHIYMQEHETCQACDNLECECPAQNPDDWHECFCTEPAFGETCNYNCCHECHLFLEAVEAAEKEAGCDRSESRPALGIMIEQIQDGDFQEAKRYWKKAASMFPEIRKPYLGWLWRRTFKHKLAQRA